MSRAQWQYISPCERIHTRFDSPVERLELRALFGDDVVRPELAGRANATNDADRRARFALVINVHEHGGAFARLDQVIELRVASGFEPLAVAVHLPGGARHQPHRLLLAVEVLPGR